MFEPHTDLKLRVEFECRTDPELGVEVECHTDPDLRIEFECQTDPELWVEFKPCIHLELRVVILPRLVKLGGQVMHAFQLCNCRSKITLNCPQNDEVS